MNFETDSKTVAPARIPTAEARESDRDQHDTSGSGFFVSSENHIVTNAHVIEGCKTVQVTAGLSAPASARVLAHDTANDLALLKSELRSDASASLRAGVRVGESIAAFGFPLAGLLSTSGNFTIGNVSSAAGLGDDTRFLQISAPIQPGNSGGPVFDESGNIVGIVVSKLDAIKIAAVTDDVAQNVNFAIKASMLMNFLDASGIAYSTGVKRNPLPRADLAEHAKSMAVLVICKR